jgi:hypothetical protein
MKKTIKFSMLLSAMVLSGGLLSSLAPSNAMAQLGPGGFTECAPTNLNGSDCPGGPTFSCSYANGSVAGAPTSCGGFTNPDNSQVYSEGNTFSCTDGSTTYYYCDGINVPEMSDYAAMALVLLGGWAVYYFRRRELGALTA